MSENTLISSGTLSSQTKEGSQPLKVDSNLNEGEYLTKHTVNNLQVSSNVNRQITTVLLYNTKPVTKSRGIVHGMPGWVTLLPILILLGISLFSNQALVALICGVFLSSTFINGFNPLIGFLRMLDTYTINSLADTDHSKIAMFTFYLSGMIAMIQKSGGAKALAEKVTKFATTRIKGQWATFIVGLLIFLDDTASIMIVGSNFQPVTDTLYLSREKLAFLVHATSSPVSSLSPVSSWIGFQVGLIALQLSSLNIKDEDPFLLFLSTVSSRYYPIFMLVLTMATIALGKEFGPMLRAERRSHINKKVVETLDESVSETDPLQPLPNTPLRWWNAAIPIVITILVTVVALMVSGYYSLLDKLELGEQVDFSAASLAGAGDPYNSLLYSSFVGCLTCILLFKIQKIFTVSQSVEALVYGVKDVVETLIILILAWAIGTAFLDLNCAKFLVSLLSTTLPAQIIPTISFLLACIVSFTTGTSWGTTTIMFPLVIPLAHGAAPGDRNILLGTTSAILAGALFGDQCSPISSTTILCCLTSKVQVRAHVNSQLPYGILVVLSSIIFGYLPVGYNLFPDWVGLLIGSAFLVLFVFLVGAKTEVTNELDKQSWSLLLRGLALFLPANLLKFIIPKQTNPSSSDNEDDEFTYEQRSISDFSHLPSTPTPITAISSKTVSPTESNLNSKTITPVESNIVSRSNSVDLKTN